MINNIIFDLDGTLADTADDIRDSLKKAFCSLGFSSEDVNKKISSTVIGPPLKDMITSFKMDIDDNRINEIIVIFRRIYVNSGFPATALYDGIISVLEFLNSENKKLFIATNKPSKPALKILKKLDILDIFHGIVCIDTYEKNLNKVEMIQNILYKWNLNQSETIMIGDSASDIAAAQKNGLKSIAILSGYGIVDEILAQKPDFSINDHKELIHTIQLLTKGANNA